MPFCPGQEGRREIKGGAGGRRQAANLLICDFRFHADHTVGRLFRGGGSSSFVVGGLCVAAVAPFKLRQAHTHTHTHTHSAIGFSRVRGAREGGIDPSEAHYCLAVDTACSCGAARGTGRSLLSNQQHTAVNMSEHDERTGGGGQLKENGAHAVPAFGDCLRLPCPSRGP